MDPCRNANDTSETWQSQPLAGVCSGNKHTLIEGEDLQLIHSAIDDVKKRAQSQSSTSLELCWTDKLAELKARLPEDGYLKFLRFLRDPMPHDNLMNGHSWKVDPNFYSYSPLQPVLSKKTFRLLILMPAAEKNSSIKCTVAQDLIENGSAYEALSYVWGAVPGESEIELNNRPFMVTKNLKAALRTLRKPKSTRVLWVDAICINQKDSLEKQIQVEMMCEVRLYTSH